MDIATLEIFVDVMRHGSFAEVARQRRVAPSSVSRAIATLEEALAVRLFQRSTRRLAPTEAGRLYFERVEPLLEQLDAAAALAVDASAQPQGVLRITAPPSFARLNLVPLLPRLSALYPALELDLRLTDRMLDLVRDGIDVALRLGRLNDSALIARRLCPMVYVLAASPEYLSDHGAPRAPLDLVEHRCLRYPVPGHAARWRFRASGDEQGQVVEVPIDGRHIVSDGVALRDMAVAGMGIVMLPRWNMAEALEGGRLVPLLTEYEATASHFDVAAWLVRPSRAFVPRKVRAFIDFIQAAFADGAPAERLAAGLPLLPPA